MPSDNNLVRMSLKVEGVDDEETDMLTRQLRNELLESEARSVEFATSDKAAPPGAKDMLSLNIGSLILETMVHTVPGIFHICETWSHRGAGHTLKVTTIVEGGRTVTLEFSPETDPAHVRKVLHELTKPSKSKKAKH